MDQRKNQDHHGISEMFSHQARKVRRSRQWRRVLAMASALVVVLTMGWLAKPADTTEWETVDCGLEEHVHTDACYEEVLAYPHEETLPVTETRTILACPEISHVHTEKCYFGSIGMRIPILQT